MKMKMNLNYRDSEQQFRQRLHDVAELLCFFGYHYSKLTQDERGIILNALIQLVLDMKNEIFTSVNAENKYK